MNRKRYNPEQIIGKLREADVQLPYINTQNKKNYVHKIFIISAI